MTELSWPVALCVCVMLVCLAKIAITTIKEMSK